eukprot:377772-Pyramimonas_sp.AAC.1
MVSRAQRAVFHGHLDVLDEAAQKIYSELKEPKTRGKEKAVYALFNEVAPRNVTHAGSIKNYEHTLTKMARQTTSKST